MNLIVQILLRPFSYIGISHKLKNQVDWVYPLILMIISIIVIAFARMNGGFPVFSEAGLVSKVTGFLQNLPGFFIAALAAIATFNKLEMDFEMQAPAPTMKIFHNGKWVLINLTRRRFLCSMFAFLTAESIVLILMGIGSQLLFYSISAAIKGTAIGNILLYGFLGSYLFLFWQMIVTTMWGIFYLGEKIHNGC